MVLEWLPPAERLALRRVCRTFASRVSPRDGALCLCTTDDPMYVVTHRGDMVVRCQPRPPYVVKRNDSLVVVHAEPLTPYDPACVFERRRWRETMMRPSSFVVAAAPTAAGCEGHR